MTPREMTSEEVERVLGYLANGRNNSADLPFEAARVRAHLAALRARAEAAEADNVVLAGCVTKFATGGADGRCCECGFIGHHARACETGRLSRAAHPGAGYRAKVRAELLRELAKEQRESAAICRAEKLHDRAAHYDAVADGYEGQAAREEQG